MPILYEKGILHNRIKVHTIDETIDVLLNTEKSMVRFGDGEIVMIKGGDLMLQKADPEIAKGLAEILAYSFEDLIVTIPDVFETLADHHRDSRQFWRDHLLFNRKPMRSTAIQTKCITALSSPAAIIMPLTGAAVGHSLLKSEKYGKIETLLWWRGRGRTTVSAMTCSIRRAA